ncbi:MAG TPA: aquaporin [Candidatus Eisenbacteria bacterium]|nr:aquaporin [Candidatus Eisenbacteria bacterium]
MNIRALVAEVVGTFVLVGIGSLSIVSAVGSNQPSGPLGFAPFGFGLGLMAAIAIAGEASGGHFNPAVTLAALLDRRIDVVNALGYVVAQVIGAFAASFAIFLLVAQAAVDPTRNIIGVEAPKAFATEVVLTAILVAVILTVTRRAIQQAVFIIPLTLSVIHFAGIPISGASVNPARSLAPAVVAGNLENLWIFLTAPFVGAVIGWAIYRYLTPADELLDTVIEADAIEETLEPEGDA